MRELSGRVAVVTGAAHGIGRALAGRFVAEGMKVVIADVDDGALQAAVTELRALGGQVIAVRTDVSDATSVQALADATIDAFGAVHLLVNNAGVGGMQRFATTGHATWEWTLGVNLWGPVHGCRIFLPLLAAQPEAHIVNTASVGGFMAAPYLAPYFVSKAAVISLSECLHQELAEEHPNVGVSVLCPANTSTEIRADERFAPAGHVRRKDADPDLETRRDQLNTLNEAGMDPAQVAEFVVAGIRDRSLYVFTHTGWIEHVQPRFDGIVAAAQRAETRP
jgi:NAD(P)-dependent dehydrogenase (short-subunit alcohol dehydrogenase family)